MTANSATNRRWLDACICAALVLVVAALYAQTARFDFVNFDDGDYVTHNRHVATGLSVSNLRWAMSATHASNWHPLTWISHMVDVELYGLSAGGHHVTNIALHALNAVLLFLFLTLATGMRWSAALAAGLFALHPLRVESVAWVSERKDVLSTTFWLLSMLAYMAFCRRGGAVRYSLVLLSLALGLMCKPMLVTLPCVLLLLDFWPLDRVSVGWGRLVIEKLPMLAIVAGSCVLTFIAQSRGLSVIDVDALPLDARLSNAIVSVVRYLRMFAYPAGLASFYPHPATVPGASTPIIAVIAATVFTLSATGGVIILRKRLPWLAVGWLWYLGTLVPVIGIVQVGGQSHADRYTYVPMIGIAIIAAWALCRTPRYIALPCSIGLLVVLGALTHRQAGYWRNSVTLAERGINVVPNNYVALNNLGVALEERGDVDGAIRCYRTTLTIRPFDAIALNNLGAIAATRGQLDSALDYFRKSLARDRHYPGTYQGIGNVLAEMGRTDEALAAYRRALKLDPDFTSVLHNLALIEAGRGSLADAIKHWSRCVELDPAHVEAQHGLGIALVLSGRKPEGIAHLRAAIKLKPDRAGTLTELAWLLATDPFPEQRSPGEAVALAEKGFALAPDARSADVLGAAFASARQFDRAIAAATQALELARVQGNVRYAESIARRIELYKSGKPFVSDR